MIEQTVFKVLLWKKVCVFQTQSIYYRSYRAGRRQSASAYAAISKIIALQAIRIKGFSPGRLIDWMRRLKFSLHALSVPPLCGFFVEFAYNTRTSARCASYVPNELSPLTRL